MLPNEIVILEGIPYKTSGKPDKGKLREIYITKKNSEMSSPPHLCDTPLIL